MTVIGVVWLIMATALASQATDLGAWRPFTNPTQLVTMGMSKAAVLLKAGPPQTTELGSLSTDGMPFSDVWMYIRPGPSASVATLTFSGDKLVNIDVKLVP
jgi:hypothetical protein